MPDSIPQATQTNGRVRLVPVAAIIWVLAAIAVFMLGTKVISLRDEERFVNDVALQAKAGEDANTLLLHVIDGTFEFDVNSRIPADIQTGTFTDGTESALARVLFDKHPAITEIVVTPQEVIISHTSELEPAQFLRQAQRTLANFVLNERDAVDGIVAEDGTNNLIVSTMDETYRYGQLVPALIDPGTTEVYDTRNDGLNGSPLAQLLFGNTNSLEALTIEPDRLIATYADGTNTNNLTRNIEESLNVFYPRASLQTNFWYFTLSLSSEKIMSIVPQDSGIPLFLFALLFAMLEGVLGYYLRYSDDKLIRPLLRVVGVFFFFWSFVGLEPFWDYILGIIFPVSRQLVHPSGSVLQFTAQHLELVFISSMITIPSGLILSIIVTRDNFRELLPLANNLVNSGQTVPTIAIVAFMAPIIGFGFWPAIIALIAYGLLPVVRNTIAGLEAVDDFIIDSARGMGMTPTQILFRIELPIASSIIMAGVRTSMVVNVGTATLGAFVGSGGLGTPIASGIAMTVDAFILLGAIPAALLAILMDYILGKIEFVLTPKGLQIES